MRVSMAIQAGAHGERGSLGHHRHLADISMAVLAPNSGSHMDHVGEVNEIGELVNAFPKERFPPRGCFPEADDSGPVSHRRLVTVHAAGE